MNKSALALFLFALASVSELTFGMHKVVPKGLQISQRFNLYRNPMYGYVFETENDELFAKYQKNGDIEGGYYF